VLVTSAAGARANQNWLAAVSVLVIILVVAFAPVIFGGRTLLLSSWDASSVLRSGAYDLNERPPLRLGRAADPGGPAWQTEPWFKLLSTELWREHSLPLWNPYNGYGTPLAGAMQAQPFFPLTTLFSLSVTPWTYSLFVIGRLLLGGTMMLLFARQFLPVLPALFAATTFMLSGYFIMYLNMPHLSVELLAPGIFLVFELLLRKNSWAAVGGAAGMIFLGMTGGMPESLFLILSLATFYFLGRVLFTPQFRAQWVVLSVKFVIAVILGFALSAFMLFPFLEFVGVAYDAHQPANLGGAKIGLGYDGDYRTTIRYLLPLVFGPIYNSILTGFIGAAGLRGYWGVLPFFFALAAVAAVFLPKERHGGSATTRFLVAFFGLMLIGMVLKRYGNVLVNWTGALPLSEMVVYPKYLEPLTALCIAMLGGIGIAELMERRLSPRQVLGAALVTVVVVLALAASYFPEVRSPATKYPIFYYLSIAYGIALVVAAAVLCWIAQRRSDWLRPLALKSIVGLLASELLCSFLLPSFYLLTTLPPNKIDPYAGAPYIDFIRSRNADYSRVFARESFLYPNWSSAFGLMDARMLDGLFYKRYRSFMRSFLLPPGIAAAEYGDLNDRFTGDGLPYNFDSEAEKRFLALSSIKYLIGATDYNFVSPIAREVAEQNKSLLGPAFGPDILRFGDRKIVTLRGLLQNAPSQVAYKVTVEAGRPVLEGIAVIKNDALPITDGAGFVIEARDNGNTERLFETFLNPRDVRSDKDGRPFSLDLSRYSGREIELLFSTDPGPAGNSLADYSGWAHLQFAPLSGRAAANSFQQLYDEEVRVFQVPWVLPRAALYDAIEIVPDGDVLQRLKDPAFDPARKAIVSRELLPANEVDRAAAMIAGPGSAVRAASIVRYRSSDVQIETETAAPALLVLNDTEFPGWRAYVNGEQASIVTANYLFRGVFVPAGKNTVEFRYEPRSFWAGVAVALAAIVALAGLMLYERRRIARSVGALSA
jgi:hypothetical protein